MKKVITLAVALMLPIVFVSVTNTAQAQDSCAVQLAALITATENLAAVNSAQTTKVQNKLLKKLNDATLDLAKGTVRDQYKAAKKVWEYDYEVRKLYWKGDISCASAVGLDESALQLLGCIVDLYYPDNEYDPYANGTITCDP